MNDLARLAILPTDRLQQDRSSMSGLPVFHYATSQQQREKPRALPSFSSQFAHPHSSFLSSSASCGNPTPPRTCHVPISSPIQTTSTAYPEASLRSSLFHCGIVEDKMNLLTACSSQLAPEHSDSDMSPLSAPISRNHRSRMKKGTRRGTLNNEAKAILKAWMFSPEHFAHPYPSEEEKEALATKAGIEVKQLSNWFTNARKRLWQPVLRQSGVDVKNFLSTGRGGPRGTELDIPESCRQLLLQQQPDASNDSSPKSRPSPRKRVWEDRSDDSSDSDAESDESVIMHQVKRTRSSSPVTYISTKFNDECNPEEDSSDAMTSPTDATTFETFKELEIMAATSLVGLHDQKYLD